MRKLSVVAALAASLALSMVAPSSALAEDTIPVIVKNTSTYYWRVLLAGARKAGKELNIKVPELGPQQDTDINGQIAILESAADCNNVVGSMNGNCRTIPVEVYEIRYPWLVEDWSLVCDWAVPESFAAGSA